MRTPLMPMASAMAAKFGLTSSVPVSRKPVDFCSSSMKPSAPLLNTIILHGELELRQAQEIAHKHGEATIAGHRNHLAARKGRLGANGLRHRIGHRAMPERSHQAPLTIHCEVTRRPDGR